MFYLYHASVSVEESIAVETVKDLAWNIDRLTIRNTYTIGALPIFRLKQFIALSFFFNLLNLIMKRSSQCRRGTKLL